jgi:hypothetical protein
LAARDILAAMARKPEWHAATARVLADILRQLVEDAEYDDWEDDTAELFADTERQMWEHVELAGGQVEGVPGKSTVRRWKAALPAMSRERGRPKVSDEDASERTLSRRRSAAKLGSLGYAGPVQHPTRDNARELPRTR